MHAVAGSQQMSKHFIFARMWAPDQNFVQNLAAERRVCFFLLKKIILAYYLLVIRS